MEVTTFEITTETGIKTLGAEDNYPMATREANLLRSMKQDNTGKEECIICGKLTKSTLGLQMSINGYWLPADCGEPAEYDGGESQGFFTIGSDCASKFPKAFIQK